MKLKNMPNQARHSCKALLTSVTPGPLGDLHRSLGWRLLAVEGYSSSAQREWFQKLLKADPAISKIAEIGFNAGHSSHTFLSARSDITVVAFDLASHGYVSPAKAFIDARFPGRHTLIIGDSQEIIPVFAREHPSANFDLAFVDGGHDYRIAKADLLNVLGIVRPGGLVVMDDLLPWKTWGTGPTRAWTEAQQLGLVHQLQLVQDGEEVDIVQRPARTVWGLGRKAL